VLGPAEIRRLIPLREPALHIDRVTELDESQVVAEKAVSAAEAYYLSHNESSGLAYPFALVVESFAQTCVLAAMHAAGDPDLIPVIGRVAHAKQFASVLPGDVISHRARLQGRSANMFLFGGESYAGDAKVLEVQRMVITLVDPAKYRD
jgi:3-hydroxyacyl-[acyl-carrier-protein] dehydratase